MIKIENYIENDPNEPDKMGKDPRKLTKEQLNNLPHETSPTKAIRAKCLDCAYNSAEVRKCVAVGCPLWPFRMGENVFSGRRDMSEEQKKAAVDRMTKARENKG